MSKEAKPNSKLLTKQQEQQNTKTRNVMTENELLLNEMGKMAKVGGWSLDLKTNKLTWTKEVFKIHEVDKNFVPTVENAISFYDQPSQEIISNLLNETIKNGTPFDMDLKVITAKGNKIDIRTIGKAIKNNKGNIEQVFGTFQNITNNKKKNIELIRAKERFELAMQASRDGLYDRNLETNEIYYSPVWKNMLGYQDKELPNDYTVFRNLINPEDVKKVLVLQQELISQKRDRYEIEFKMKHKKGHWIDVLSRAKAIYDDRGKALRIIGTHLDITERKRMELVLLKSKEKINDSLQQIKIIHANTPNIIWKWDISKEEKFKNCYISETVDNFLELPKGTIDNSMTKFFSYILPKYLPLVDDTIKNAINNIDTPIHVEYEVKKASGKVVWFSSSGQVIKENNKLTIYGSTIDVTEKKQNEEKLLQSDRVFNLSIDMFCIAGFDGYFKYLNPAWGKTLGWSNEELLSKPWLDFVHPNDIKKTENVNSVIIDGKEIYQFENRYMCKDGSTKWLSWNSQPFPKENIMIGAVRDITETKKVELELLQAKEKAEESEKIYRAVFETNNAIKLAIEPKNGNIIDVNTAALNFYGYSKAKMLTMKIGDINTLSQEKIQIEIQAALTENRNYFNFKHRLANGDIRDVEVHSTPISIRNSQYLYSIIHDITDKLKNKRELLKAKEKAEESDKLKSAFLANMSHEIRTPMNGILGFTELLQSSNLSVENQKNYIEIIRKSSNRLLNTVNDIIEISKIESGGTNIIKSEVDLIKHLKTNVIFFKPEAEKKGLKLIIKNEVGENELTVFTDKNKMSSIVSNIIKNAIKYTNSGTIEVGFKIEKNQLLFSCKDSGLGIPKKRQEAIFNRFEQADIEDKQAHQGSGLGLAIVKSYVEMLDGKIWVESEVGKGSEFFVSLPYSPINVNKTDSISNEINSDSDKKKIHVLIAEDDELSALHLSILIKELVEQVTLVENGIDAVEKCKNDSSIDLVLMDLKMPQMNGYEATKKIREFNTDIVIIAQTAFVLEGDKQKALDAGCTDYIGKPIKREKLVELINKYY